ncbi:MAG: M28 family peptidase [Geodermatophilaceae bacterium]|nr:M28 family peptidase [Geodermatophilaceae bacterium]
MVSSPNFTRGIYDGDGSDFGLVGPEGSAQIEAEFESHFTNKGLPFQGTEFSGRSDYQAFINNGIPSGGLFTGAEGIKTEEEAAIYGGVAGEQHDPCYHQACDSFTPVRDGADAELYAALDADYPLVGNVNLEALDTNADAIAHLTAKYAISTASVTRPAITASTTTAATAGRDGDAAA